MHTDAIWRACRIILDIRMHRGEITVEEATDFLVEQTSFERPERRRRGQLVHVPPDLPAVLPARPDAAARPARRRAAPARRRGSASRRFHDTLLRNGSLPDLASTAALADAAEGLTRPCRSSRPSTSRRAGRGSSTGPAPGPASAPRPTARSGSPSGSSAMGARLIHLVDFDGARAGARPTSRRSARSPRGSPSRSSSPAAWTRPTRSSWPSRPARPASCSSTVIADRPDDLRACLAVAGDWLAVGLDPRPERLAAFPWRRPAPPTVDGLVGELVGAGVAPVRPDPRRREADAAGLARTRDLVRSYDAEILVAGGVSRLDGHPPPARHRRRRRHPR